MARPETGQVVAWYVCTVVACVFLIARIVVRLRLLKRLYLDDFFVSLAALCLIADLAIQHYMFNLGMTEPNKMTQAQMVNMMKMIIPGSTLYVTSLWLIKASLVIFYKRLADRTRYQMVYNITLGLLAATWLALFFDIVFQCYPPDRQWKSIGDPSLACSTTQSTINYWITILFNIFSDVLIICLPISQIARLKMPKKQKWGVMSVFLLGIIVVITSIIRAIYSHRNEQMITCTVSMIETAIAIIASCLPVLRTLVFGSHSRTGTYSKRRGYELSGSGVNTHPQQSQNGNGGPSRASAMFHGGSKLRPDVSVSAASVSGSGVDELSRHDSEDTLVRGNDGITVKREYLVHDDERSLR
ncbi:hypothetical protein BJX99DRAFT_107875 [Aspergillus californicus]